MINTKKFLFWRKQDHFKDEIAKILEKAQRNGTIDVSSKKMIDNILDFTHILVREIMIPRTEIRAVSTEATIDEIIREVAESRHTRIPVYRNTIDNIIGILNVKDLLQFRTQEISGENILSILTKPYYIPETKNTHLLFQELKENKKHIAIVIDEYGGTSGLVTLEDLLEEIVGEINDEYETMDALRGGTFNPDGEMIIDGRTEIEKIEEYFNIVLKKGRYETLGGYIMDHTKKIPLTGENIQIDGLDLTIVNADERSIKKVKIKKLKESIDAR